MGKQVKKSSNTLTIVLVIAALLGVGYMWLRSQLGLIQIAGVGVPFQKLDGTNLVLKISVDIINPSAIAARITGFTGYIISPSGNLVSTVFLSQPGTIQRYEQSKLEFTSIVKPTSLLAEVWSVVQSGKMPDWKGYKIKGQLRIYGIPVPVETTIV